LIEVRIPFSLWEKGRDEGRRSMQAHLLTGVRALTPTPLPDGERINAVEV
jgi:hypothetical protein